MWLKSTKRSEIELDWSWKQKKKKKKKSQMFTCCNSESCQCHGDWHAIGIYMGVCMCVNANLAGPSTFKETEYV